MTKSKLTHLIDNFTAACGLISSIAAQLGAKIPPISKLDAGTVSKYEKALSKAIDDLKDGEPVLPGGQELSTFDDLVDQEIARLGDDAKPRPTPTALTKTTAAVDATDHVAMSGIDLLVDIGREIGIDVIGQTPGDAARAIHAALLKLKSPGDLGGEDGSASKGDSLAEAMSFGRKAEAAVRDEVSRLRLVVQRIAGAMQVPEWDKDGTELIEKAQRWDQARYALKKRIAELEVDDSSTHTHSRAASSELRYMLGLVASARDVAKWLSNKPKTMVTSQVLDVLERPTGIGTFKPLVPADTVMMVQSGLLSGIPDDGACEHIRDLFEALARSATASAEFCDLVNLIILPILARQNPPSTR